MKRLSWIEPKADISLKRQCVLVSVCRATVYARRKPKQEQERDATLMSLIDQEYTRHPYYGSRKMVVYLAMQGQRINRKCVQRLMRNMGLQAMAPSPNTSKPHPAHKVYPYLLRGVSIVRPNQVWSSDITYIRLTHGFAYLTVVLDWYSRCVLSWRISNTQDARFCVDCLEEALAHYGKPEVFNSDQGSQYTSTEFTAVLKREGVAISMDGRGRAFDNIFVERLWRSVKHEDVYLKGYATMGQLWLGISAYFAHYNAHRPHQSLGQCTPQDVYRSAQGGGAIITDKYGDRPACAQAVSVDKAPAPNRSHSVRTAPTGCVPRPQTPTGLVLGKEQYLFKFKTQNGAAPSSCVVTEQTLNWAGICLDRGVHFITTTVGLMDRLQVDKTLRRLCGFSPFKKLPNESTFSRVFAQLAERRLLERVHAELITSQLGEQLIGHISRDGTAICAREKPQKKVQTTVPAASSPAPRKRGRPRAGEVVKTKPVTQIAMQMQQTAAVSLAQLPTACDRGTKCNAQGYKNSWNGYKLHMDTADCGVPISVVLTSASVHDSQVAVPLSQISAQRVTSLYDVMDAAYCSEELRQHSRNLGHVPLIDHNPRNGTKRAFDTCEAQRYKERTVAERMDARLKDEFGANRIYVRTHSKVMCHVMFGILALCADQIMRLLR